jgi:hypothetical protein
MQFKSSRSKIDESRTSYDMLKALTQKAPITEMLAHSKGKASRNRKTRRAPSLQRSSGC